MDLSWIGEFAMRWFGVMEDGAPGVPIYFRPIIEGSILLMVVWAIAEMWGEGTPWAARVLSTTRTLAALYVMGSVMCIALLAVRVFCVITNSSFLTAAGREHHQTLYVLWLSYTVFVWSGAGFLLVCVRTARRFITFVGRRSARCRTGGGSAQI